MLRAIVYLLAITVAEIASVVLPSFNSEFLIAGLLLYTIILLVMLVDAARLDRFYQGRIILSLALVPLIRILSLTMPLTQVPRLWWYPLIYLPLFITTVAAARVLDYKPRDIGISLGSWPAQILVALLGLGLGYLEYIILSPEPLVASFTWQAALLPALLIFVFTGVTEEFIFRGVLQKSAVDLFGGWGIVYISVIFAVLHIGWAAGPDTAPLAWLDLPFALGIGLLFGWIVKRTGSLLGVILCHGVINVVLFIVAPFLFQARI